jgi:hypothetical protein
MFSMSCESKRQHRRNILAAIFVALVASAANAGAPAGMSPGITPELIPRPHLLDLTAPQLRPMSELGRPPRFDQARESFATGNATRQPTQTNFDADFGPKSAFVIHWTRPELVIIARNFRRSGLPVVTLWRPGRGLLALGLSPRGVPGLYFTQKVRD